MISIVIFHPVCSIRFLYMKSNLNCSHAKQTFAYFKVASFLKMRHSFNHKNELIY